MATSATPDTTLPTGSLTCSASSTVTAAGNVTFTVDADDDVGIASVELRRDDVLLAPKSVTCEFSQALAFEDNGQRSYVAVITDKAGNIRTQTLALNVNIPSPIPCDTFTNLPLGQSLASAAWDTVGRAWLSKTFMSGDGAGAAKIDTIPYSVCANWLAKAGDVGQAVFFKVVSTPSTANLLGLAIACLGSTQNHYQVDGIEVLLASPNYFYLKENGKSTMKSASFVTEVGGEYCLEVCKTADPSGKVYNARLSHSVGGVRGEVIASRAITLTAARAAGDTLVQLRTSAANKDAIKITRVEALTTAFDVIDTSAATPITTTPTPTPTPVNFTFPADGTAIAGPPGLSFKFGPAGAPVAVEMIEKLYTNMSVGYAGVTQSRWMSRPITVNGIQFVLLPGLDSNGRADCWIIGAFATASSQTNVNREYAHVDFQVNYLGNDINLWGAGTTYSYNHQRATTIPWETEPMPWGTTSAFVNNMMQSGVFLRHDTRGAFGVNENSSQTDIDKNPFYQPNKGFSSSLTPSGTPKYPTVDYVGDQFRGTPAGGERATIGFVHRTIARMIAELGAKNNPSWVTAERLKTAQYTAAAIAQYPHSGGLLFPLDQRLIDPSQVPLSTNQNYAAWGPCVGIPQPGLLVNVGEEANRNARYDNAHPANKISFHAWHFSRDPHHLYQTQAQAITCLAFGSGGKRGSDGKILRITIEEERGFWQGLQAVVHAWHATPAGTMPKPFRDKAFFAKAIDNTLQFIRDNFMQPSAAYSGITYDAARFWRIVSPFSIPQYPGEIMCSPFMVDYGHQILGEMLMLGYSAGRDVVEWHSENLRMRAQAGGNWYLADSVVANGAGLAACIAKAADTTLPYTDLASYKTWYRSFRPDAYKDGVLTPNDWKIDWGRDTYMFTGILNLYAELARRGLITLTFDAALEEKLMRDRHPGPYVGPNGLPLNYELDPKYWFRYKNAYNDVV